MHQRQLDEARTLKNFWALPDPKLRLKRPLTRRQLQVLLAVRDSLADRGISPTIREIGDAVGLNSASSVHRHLRRLEDLGIIERDPSSPRSIRLRLPRLDGLRELSADLANRAAMGVR